MPIKTLFRSIVACTGLLFFLAATPLSQTPAAPSSTTPNSVMAFLSCGTSAALIEVISVENMDARPVDGNLIDLIKFKIIKHSGIVPPYIIVTKYGGMRPYAPPLLKGPLYPIPLVSGKRYWIVFNDSDLEKYQQAVVAWWPGSNAPTRILETAIARDIYYKGSKPLTEN